MTDLSSAEGLGVKPVEMAPAGSDEVTVRVTSISLNRGRVATVTNAATLRVAEFDRAFASKAVLHLG